MGVTTDVLDRILTNLESKGRVENWQKKRSEKNNKNDGQLVK